MMHRFTIYFAGINDLADDLVEELYEAGLDDGSPFSRCGRVGIGVDREADSLEAAIRSAVADARRAGVTVASVVIDKEDLAELVTEPAAAA